MFFVEDKNFLNQKHIDFVETQINKSLFPFYYQPYVTEEQALESFLKNGNDYKVEPALAHTLLVRKEHRGPMDGPNSSSYDIFNDMLMTFCEKNSIEYKETLRAAVNLTFPNGIEKCDVHQDHNYPHKQLLIYLNEVRDKNSKTVILDTDNKTILKEIVPEKYKGVCFSSMPHFHYFPKIGCRMVCVFTFI